MSVRSLVDLYKLRRNLHEKPSNLEKMQNQKLKAVVRNAYEQVSFYHKKFDSAGIKPDDIITTKDLTKIPVTTKAEIQQASFEEIVAKNTDLNKCVQRKTSGSTGIPLRIISDRGTVDFERALWGRTYLEDGLKLWNKMALIMDPPFFQSKQHWYQHLGLLRRTYISIFDSPEKQAAVLRSEKPYAIQSYPSSLAVLADHYEQKAESIRPRLIFTLSEMLDRETRQRINSAFKTELFDLYGCVEFGIIAWECNCRAGYHINSDSVVMEFIRNGEAVAPGERGEIVCTSLIKNEMPLIRYKIGDFGVLGDEQCQYGVTLPLMKTIEGRADDFLTTTDGRIIPPTVFFPYPFESFEGIAQFRVVQERTDKLKIQLVVEEGFPRDAQVFEKARMNIKRIFGADMEVEFETVEKIGRDSSGKLRKIVSHVPVKLH